MRQPRIDLSPARPQRLPIEASISPPPDTQTAAPARQVFSLNHGWSFHRCECDTENVPLESPDRVEWELINLPHSVRLEPLNASGGRNFQGICWYCKKLALPPQWKDRIIYLQFEGAMQVADIWLNGQKVATHHGGYTPFTI